MNHMLCSPHLKTSTVNTASPKVMAARPIRYTNPKGVSGNSCIYLNGASYRVLRSRKVIFLQDSVRFHNTSQIHPSGQSEVVPTIWNRGLILANESI